MSSLNNYIHYDGIRLARKRNSMDNPVLTHSSSGTSGMSSDYSGQLMHPQIQQPYPLHDPTVPAHSIPSQNVDWWGHNSMSPTLNTSINMMADLELTQSAGTGKSPITQEDYPSRRTSTASNAEVAEWQEKVRVERRKVQNRAAQRAYRERKDRAISDLRELLEKKESQYKALQVDHKHLQEQYEKLRAAKQETSGLSLTTTCDPSDLLSPNIRDLNIANSSMTENRARD